MVKIRKQNISLICFKKIALLSFVILIFMLSKISSAESLDYTKFYTVAPNATSTGLWTIDPSNGATSLVTSLQLPDGSNPNFMTNALAFSPNNELFGWDSTNKQLFNINYSTGQVNYIGSPGTLALNGLAFDGQGSLYGVANGNINQTSSPAALYSINTTTGDAAKAGNSYINTTYNSLAVNYQTGELYAVTGGATNQNYLMKVNPTAQPTFVDTFFTNTTGNYTWTTSGSGTGYSWNNNGYVTMDADTGDWQVAWVSSQGNGDIPSSGYAKVEFDITKNVGGQSRLWFTLGDTSNYYQFLISDVNTSTGQYIKKTVNSIVTEYNSWGSLVSSPAGYKTWEIWWNPTNLRMDLNGTTVQDITTSDTTIIDPSSFTFRVYRVVGNWDSVNIDPGVAQIIANLGSQYDGIGSEFDPATGKLYAVRNNNTLFTIDVNTGQTTEIGILGNEVITTNLAHTWQQATVVPEPISSILFVTGGAVLGFNRLRKKSK